MNRHLLVLLMLVGATTLTHADSRGTVGTWTAELSDSKPDQLQLSVQVLAREQHGSPFAVASFDGLTLDQIRSSTRVPVQFALKREAGTLQFEGTFRNGLGAGEFLFEPNREFPKALRAMGVEFRPEHGDEDHELFHLALFDVSSAFIRSMRDFGYDVPLEKYVEFRIFDVNPDYVREMASVGFRQLSGDKLVETRIHGATPEYIREMRAAGEDLSLDQYIQSRIFSITPEFAKEMGRLGYPDLDRETLQQFRIHDVSADFVQQLRTLGYDHVPAQKLVEMRIHGVTPEFIRRVEKAGYHEVPVDKLVQMRIFDIDPEMVKALGDEVRSAR